MWYNLYFIALSDSLAYSLSKLFDVVPCGKSREIRCRNDGNSRTLSAFLTLSRSHYIFSLFFSVFLPFYCKPTTVKSIHYLTFYANEVIHIFKLKQLTLFTLHLTEEFFLCGCENH